MSRRASHSLYSPGTILHQQPMDSTPTTIPRRLGWSYRPSHQKTSHQAVQSNLYMYANHPTSPNSRATPEQISSLDSLGPSYYHPYPLIGHFDTSNTRRRWKHLAHGLLGKPSHPRGTRYTHMASSNTLRHWPRASSDKKLEYSRSHSSLAYQLCSPSLTSRQIILLWNSNPLVVVWTRTWS